MSSGLRCSASIGIAVAVRADLAWPHRCPLLREQRPGSQEGCRTLSDEQARHWEGVTGDPVEPRLWPR